MPTPTRPVTGAAIASVWGQAVHDYTFAPCGAIVTGGVVTMLAGQAYRDLPMDTPVQDPGGWLDAPNDRLVVPTGGEGLYLCHLVVKSIDGAASDETGVVMRLNGAEAQRVQFGQEGATAVFGGATVILDLTAGDLITGRVRKIGSGASADVNLVKLSLVRLGAEIGEP